MRVEGPALSHEPALGFLILISHPVTAEWLRTQIKIKIESKIKIKKPDRARPLHRFMEGRPRRPVSDFLQSGA